MFTSGGQSYEMDFAVMKQKNLDTGMLRCVRFQIDKPQDWLWSSDVEIMKLILQRPASNFYLFKTVDRNLFNRFVGRCSFHDRVLASSVMNCRKTIGYVAEAYCVQNWELWRAYQQCRDKFVVNRQTARGQIFRPCVRPSLLGSETHLDALTVFERDRGVDDDANEMFLFHGCSSEVACRIAAEGFDPRTSGRDGSYKPLYGHGCYFARQICKALQYPNPPPPVGQTQTVIVARVLLGEPHVTTKVCRDIARPPARPDGGLYDSVVAAPGYMEGHPHCDKTQKHWEYVTFDKAQAYPSFILTVKTCSA